ncbi:MAG: DUF4175 family protein, partial [Planctomycetota bacterium]
MASAASINAPVLTPSSIAPAAGQLSRIRREMHHVTMRYRSKQFWLLTGVLGMAAVCLAGMLRGAAISGSLSWTTVWVLDGFLVLTTLIVAFRLAKRITGDEGQTAARIEEAFPELGQRLLTTVELDDDKVSQPLAQHLIRQTHDHFRRRHWPALISGGSLWLSRIFGLLSIGAIILLAVTGRSEPAKPSFAASLAPGVAIDDSVRVQPGNVTLERGSNLVVTAEFASSVPERTMLITETDGGAGSELLMERRLVDPLVAAFLPAIDESLHYRVRIDEWESETYRVDVFEFPSLIRSDASLEFPEYTGRPSRTVEDTRKVTVVEGSQVEWKLRLNKPVVSCMLETVSKQSLDDDLTDAGLANNAAKQPIVCVLESLDPPVYSATIDATESIDMRLILVDDAERQNKFPPKLSIKVLPNKTPKIRIENARDKTVSALQEVPLSVTLQDDYGVVSAGWTYTHNGETTEKTLASSSRVGGPNQKNLQVNTQLDFESIEAEVDDLVSYSFWVEDVDSDGNPRRTSSDLFFIDVRPFDEIFRRGQSAAQARQQQQQQQGGGAAQKVEESLQTQKQIVIALWNLTRTENATSKTSSADRDEVARAQSELAQKFAEDAQELDDTKSKEVAATVLEAMKESESKTRANELADARRAAELAVAGLLKLRAREFEITRQQQQQQSQG